MGIRVNVYRSIASPTSETPMIENLTWAAEFLVDVVVADPELDPLCAAPL